MSELQIRTCKTSGINTDTVVENYKVKVLWDMKIQTDKTLDYSRPDIVGLKKEGCVCKIGDV